MKPRRRHLFSLSFLLLFWVVFFPGCVRNTATGKLQFNSLSRAEEIQLGEEAKNSLTDQYGGMVNDAPDYALQAYVTEVGLKLTAHVEEGYHDLPWEFTLLDSEIVNAFALPGGKVFLSRGLAAMLDTEAELAGVLGHEVGHVTAEHADKRITNQLLLAGLVVGASVAAGQSDSDFVSIGVPVLVGVGGQGFLLKFGRGEELESDRLGMRYMSKAGYSPAGQLGVMMALKRASEGTPRQPEILSTHPLAQTRIDQVKRLLREEYPDANSSAYFVGAQEYRQRMLEPLARYLESKPPPDESMYETEEH